jgi:hypothetical protein
MSLATRIEAAVPIKSGIAAKTSVKATADPFRCAHDRAPDRREAGA